MLKPMTRAVLPLLLAALLLFALAGPPAARAEDREYAIAWSVWTGWMPFRLMRDRGFLARRAAEQGVKVKLIELKGYMDTVQAFAAGQVDGCALTSMESLQAAASGLPVVVTVVIDTSDGGDGILARRGMKIADLKGQTVLLEQGSVSHYLLARALALAGLSERDVQVQNIPGDEAGKAFLTDDRVKAVVTWHPHLFLATEAGKGEVIFDSAQVKGEIVDLIAMNGNVVKDNPRVAQAVVDAWYDAMAMIEDPKTRPQAVAIMAEAAGAQVEEFEKMLKGTVLYTDPARAADVLEGQPLKETMAKVKQFTLAHELLKDPDVSVTLDGRFVRALLRRRGGK